MTFTIVDLIAKLSYFGVNICSRDALGCFSGVILAKQQTPWKIASIAGESARGSTPTMRKPDSGNSF